MDGARSQGPRVLVVGCGGVGGIVCAGLLEQGFDVTPLTRNPLIADAVNTHGFRVRGEGAGTVPGRAVTRLRAGDRFELVLLCTQPTEVEEAARQTVPYLAADGWMVCLQNGLCEPRVAPIAGAGRTAGAIVSWGATMVEAGIYDRTSAGGFVVGAYAEPSPTGGATGELEVTAPPTGRPELLAELGRRLECVGPVTMTENLAGARWSKLALNCAISSLGTVGGDRLGPLLRQRHVRRLALEVMTEAVAVARAEGVRLEKVAGTLDLEWIALTDAERAAAVGSPSLVAKHALLLAVGARYRRLRSSMLAALERGRPPAVDFLNGEVATRGARHGIPTPVNDALRSEILLMARGKRQPGTATLRALFDGTRAAVGPGPAFVPTEVVGAPSSAVSQPEEAGREAEALGASPLAPPLAPPLAAESAEPEPPGAHEEPGAPTPDARPTPDAPDRAVD
ncbi:MAG: 2-dehydropantoate 2-reductase [Polyangiaceae bacterium]|nr:2-dehydropantoate 2-reductase [Polyangiaceae bacterium]